jgi:hypothetical protein
MPNWSLEVIEYQSSPRRPGPGLHHPNWYVNDRQLTAGMVRATLARNAGRQARRFTAALVRPTLRFMLNWQVGVPLAAHPLFFGALRDFSITSRVGELGQGIAYCFWHWAHNFSVITDFRGWATSMHINIPLAPAAPGQQPRALRTPDYVMLNPRTGTAALMEAKGTMGSNHNSGMSDALRQCRIGRSVIPVQNAYGCVVALNRPTPASAGPVVPATLHFRDPESPASITDEFAHEIFRRSYATWFDITGDEDMAKWCRTPLKQQPKRLKNESARIRGTSADNVEDPLRGAMAEAFGLDAYSARFTIAASIADALRSREAWKRIDWYKIIERATHDSFGNVSRVRSKTVHFPDGTAIAPR